MFPQLSQQKER